MRGGKTAAAPQKPADIGLFDDTARGQSELFAKPYAPDAETARAVGAACLGRN